MKKQWVILSLMTVFVCAAAVATVQAAPGSGGKRNCAECVKCDKGGSGPFQGRMAQVLDLNEEQQAKIAAIVAEERTQTEPLRQRMQENREQMRQLMRAETLDEAAIRSLTAQKAEVSADLAISRARTRNLIQAQLTPEQRVLADKLLPLMHERRGGKGFVRNPDCYSRRGHCPQEPAPM